MPWQVVTALAVFAALAVSRPLGKWFVTQVRESMVEWVSEAVHPQIDKITSQLEAVQAQNTLDHGHVVAELEALTGRQGDVEHRLAAVEGLVAAQTRTAQEDS